MQNITCLLVSSLGVEAVGARSISTSVYALKKNKNELQPMGARRYFERTDFWKKYKHNKDSKDLPWHSCVPQTAIPNEWSRKEAYFGRYDFISMLGNDVTLQPKVLAKGPEWLRVRSTTAGDKELKRGLRQRKKYTEYLFAEDMSALQKKIKYLSMKVNRKIIQKERQTTDLDVHGLDKQNKRWRTQ